MKITTGIHLTALIMAAAMDVSIACHGFGAGCSCGTLDGNVCQPCDGREQYQQSYGGMYSQPTIGYAGSRSEFSAATAGAVADPQPYVAPSQVVMAPSYYNNYNAQPVYSTYDKVHHNQQTALSTSEQHQKQQFLQSTLPQNFDGAMDADTVYDQFAYPTARGSDNQVYEEHHINSKQSQNTFDFSGFVNGVLGNARQHAGASYYEDAHDQDIGEHKPSSPFVENSGYDSQEFVENGYRSEDQSREIVLPPINGIHYSRNEGTTKWQTSGQTPELIDFDARHNSLINKPSENADASEKTTHKNISESSFNYDPTISFYHQTLSPAITENDTNNTNEQANSQQTDAKPVEVQAAKSHSVSETSSNAPKNTLQKLDHTNTNQKNYLSGKSLTERTVEDKRVGQNKMHGDDCELLFANPDAESRSRSSYVTYYDQICHGKILGESHNETIVSATRKCAQLGCTAANAVQEAGSNYYVIFLDGIQNRERKVGTYCISGLGPKKFAGTADDLIKLHVHPVQRSVVGRTAFTEQTTGTVAKHNATGTVRMPLYATKISRMRRFQQLGSKVRNIL